MTLPKDLLEAIEATLPSIQVKALKDSLNELDRLRVSTEEQELKIADLRDERQEVKSRLANSENKYSALKEELVKTQGERDHYQGEVRDAELAALRATVESINSTTDKFLKNTIYRESLQHQVVNEDPNMISQPVGVSGQYGMVQQGVRKTHIPVTDNKETTTE